MREYTIQLIKITGTVIFAQRTVRTYQGSAEQLEETYKKVLRHNLLFGWWGIVAVIWNAMALSSNAKARKSLRALVHQDQMR